MSPFKIENNLQAKSVTRRLYHDSIRYSVLQLTPLLIINACRKVTTKQNNPPNVCLVGNPPTDTKVTIDRWCHMSVLQINDLSCHCNHKRSTTNDPNVNKFSRKIDRK